MPPLYREHVVNGPYTLERGKLTFKTTGLRIPTKSPGHNGMMTPRIPE